MLLDHARDFWSGFRVRPLDLATTTPVLFATRWVTHFCAPAFVLLAGIAAYLFGARGSPAELRRFLVSLSGTGRRPRSGLRRRSGRPTRIERL